MLDANANSKWINLLHGTMGQQKMQERSVEELVFQARSERRHKKRVVASLLDISWIISRQIAT